MAAGLYLTLPEESPFTAGGSPIAAPPDTGIRSVDTGVRVEVVGAGIENPGTYRLSPDSAIIDLVETAGGLRPGAVTSGLDWHRTLYEGLKLTVPTRAVFRDARAGTRTLSNEDLIRFRSYGDNTEEDQPEDPDLIELNEAGRRELQRLPGIGPVLSGSIVDYRKDNDGFDRVEELMNIHGIGEVTYQELRAKVTVD